jgi:hypothetical protein
MSRNATASWSGYNHQGKVGLLVCLRKLKELNCENFGLMRMELETKEDVRLIEDGIDIEVHQVKAYGDGTTIGPYKPALKDFEKCDGGNYLHTICEITNWRNLTPADNPSQVERFCYTDDLNYCALDMIDVYIFDEIKNVLGILGHPNWNNLDWQKNAFNEYLAVLDCKIRVEHHTKASKDDYEIAFEFTDIVNIVSNPPVHYRMVVNGIRNEIYNQYVEFVKELDEGGIVLDALHEKKVEEIIEEISSLDDGPLESFLSKVWPASTSGKKLFEQTLNDDFFSRSAFADTFLDTVIKVSKRTLTLEEKVCPIYKFGGNHVLTAVNNPLGKEASITKLILENKNFNIERYDADFIINENFRGKLSDHAGRIVPGRKFLLSKDPEYIPRTEAIDKLNL